MENREQKLKEIRKSKQEEYGTDFGVAMNDIGHLWSVLLGLDAAIPGYMVANMYVAAKLYRTKEKFKKVLRACSLLSNSSLIPSLPQC